MCANDASLAAAGSKITVQGIDRATQLKFECPRISHYASHYHYAS